MKIFIAICLTKFINFLSKLIMKKEGSVIGGYWALRLFPNVLSNIKYPKYILGITGSSGKTSTTELVYNILNKNSITVAYNKNGSNAINAIATLILSNCNLNGVFNKDVLLMELDEKYMKEIFKYFKPTHLVITNITRDQPPRNIHPENIYNEINNVIDNNMHLVLNEDDPLVKRIGINHKGKTTYYSVDKNEYSSNPILNNIDASYCPICHTKLKYKYHQYGHIGDYYCPNKDFVHGKSEYKATNIDFNNKEICINKNKIKIPSNFLYSVYFTTAAYTLTNLLGISSEEISYVLNNDEIKTKRLNIYNFNNRKWQMLSSKNENNLSYKQSIDYIMKERGHKTIVLGFENSSRRYSENDLSWIWDIDFENLNNKNISKIFIIGRFRYDIFVRLQYAKIPKNKIILVDDLNNIMNLIRTKSKGNIYSMVCFDMEIILKSFLQKESQDEN